MRLAGLKPHWITPNNWADATFYVGVSFLCPHCPVDAPEHGPGRRRRLAVMFYPPIDPTGLQTKYGGEAWWPKRAGDHQRVSGETFDTLSLFPSVGFDSIAHWHGNITNGECLP